MKPKDIERTSIGVFCKAGDFYIDPWGATNQCIITHAHGDHARWGSKVYYSSPESLPILKHRLGEQTEVIPLEYEKKIRFGNAWVSLHPAGHILGSAQIRIEHKNYVTVVSGDYKRELDITCLPFQPVQCNEFVTESTFGLPIYQWQNSETIIQQIVQWWKENAERDQASILFCYTLGKAQRLMGLLKPFANAPIIVHGAIASINSIYRELGVPLAPWITVSEIENPSILRKSLVLAPPSAMGTPWMKRFIPSKTATASGWMQVRGTRRRSAVDTGFVLSDHSDWPSLIRTVKETQADKIWVTHGSEEQFARYLAEEEKIKAAPFHTLEANLKEDED